MNRFLPRALPGSLLIAFLAGAATVLAFAPFGLWPLQIATLALCFTLLMRAATVREAGLIGWAYGFGWSVLGIHWLFVSMHRYGGMPAWMAALAVVLLSLYVGAFYGVFGAAAAWIRSRWKMAATPWALVLLPSLWALAEWTRGWLFTGFPWLVSGYAHSDGPLAGYAPLVGVYGIGFVSALIAAAVACWPVARLPVAGAAAVLVAGFGLKAIDWTVPHGTPISVRLLQGNVPQEMKFEPDQIRASLTLYRDMIGAAPADLVATPETALPLLADRLPPGYLAGIVQDLRRTNSHLLLGVPASDAPDSYANRVLGFGPSAPAQGSVAASAYRYDKQHLVPFGEFIPPGFKWFVDMMHIPLGDFSRGAAVQQAFPVKDQWVMPNICYEDLFGGEIALQIAAAARAGQPQPTMLLNVSNIAWFGDTIALPQHLQISRLRSIETGRPMLRATNTGATAVVGPKGEVSAQLEPFTRGTLSASVQGMTGLTPYVRMGDAGIVVLSLGLAAAAIAAAAAAARRKAAGGE